MLQARTHICLQLNAHPTVYTMTLITLSLATLTSSNLNRFAPQLVRENLVSSWDPTSLQRLDCRLPADINLTTAEPMDDIGKHWKVSFDDGVVGEFAVPPGDIEEVELEHLPKKLWGSEGMSVKDLETVLNAGGSARFSYELLMGDSTCDDPDCASRASEQLGAGRARLSSATARARQSLFEAVQMYGMAIIEGAPAVPDAGKVIADAIVGAVETTVFGYKFVIKQVDDPHNLAFANIALQQHTDFTYLKKVPDVALFHCIQNAESGGDSLWADSFALAETLRRDDPDAFHVLASTPVRFVDLTDKWDLRATYPTIELDPETKMVKRVYFNERTRDSWRQWAAHDTPGAVTPSFYKALRKFEALADRAEWHAVTALKPGEVALFDNARVMHSRTAFQGNRHMEGSYISWESIHATWRALNWQVHGEPYMYSGRQVGATM